MSGGRRAITSLWLAVGLAILDTSHDQSYLVSTFMVEGRALAPRTMGAAQFKEQCLALLDRLGPEGLVVTKRGTPVARVLPYHREHSGLIGILRGKIRVRGDIMTTGVRWNADAES